MTFNSSTDANYLAVNVARNAMSGAQRANFDEFLIKYLCAQATTSITLNTAAMTTAIANALQSSGDGIYSF